MSQETNSDSMISHAGVEKDFHRVILNHPVIYNAHTLYLFTSNNLKDIVVFGYIFAIVNANCVSTLLPSVSTPTDLTLAQRTPAIIFWSWIHLLLFSVHNQWHPDAAKEDAINKPWRPLPSGRISSESAKKLRNALWPVCVATAYFTGTLGTSLLTCIQTAWYNELNANKGPMLKSLVTATGFACFLAGPLEVALRYPVFSSLDMPLAWLCIVTAAMFTTAHAQDFRDRIGDKVTKRRTLPLVIGDFPARVLVAIGVITWSVVGTLFWNAGITGLMISGSIGLCLHRPAFWE
ncbi:hypothetical protein EV356DRAFT_568081 [Viridothelium virens]|uniref:UbiA prenyltransferase n=1 Tax=Viridothelium virens TaxID=1048519 RepID=A0A6A6H513_VIRVR|nr:hypothetical protein EV356DRAFT_568081 [Viridothelium virens]